MTYRDTVGTPIEVGCEVVYNMSGSLVPGKVVDIFPGTRSPFRIERSNQPFIFNKPFKVSKVRHASSIFVLKGPQRYNLSNPCAEIPL